MPKHRSAGFAVVREKLVQWNSSGCVEEAWEFDGIVGVYYSVDRADEVASGTIQKYLDLGMDPEDPEYRCTVHTTNYYDE